MENRINNEYTTAYYIIVVLWVIGLIIYIITNTSIMGAVIMKWYKTPRWCVVYAKTKTKKESEIKLKWFDCIDCAEVYSELIRWQERIETKLTKQSGR